MTLAKLFFYILYVFNGLSTLFYCGVLYQNITSSVLTGKNESTIIALAIIIMVVGIYLAHEKANVQKNFGIADMIFVIAWILAFLVVLIGLLFFNGPIRWN